MCLLFDRPEGDTFLIFREIGSVEGIVIARAVLIRPFERCLLAGHAILLASAVIALKFILAQYRFISWTAG
jgi:hypothetical protein